MQSMLIVLCAVCTLMISEAAFLRTGETKDGEAAQQPSSSDIRVSFLEQYSPGKYLKEINAGYGSYVMLFYVIIFAAHWLNPPAISICSQE